MNSSEQFNIRWNNYTSVLQNVFRKLLEGEQFVDVTLACEGQSIKCHRLILSACSTYFDRILTENQSSNLVIYIKDMKMWELRALVTFMYNGEVSISQQKLPHLCKAAEALKIKGLAHDTSLSDADLDRMEDDDVEDYHIDEGKELLSPRENNRSLLQGHSKSLLRQQHNNLSSFAAAATATSRQQQPQSQLIKRKILTRPPKLVKMQRVERPATNGSGSSLKPQLTHPTSNKVILKKPEQETNRSSTVKQEALQEDEMNDSYSNEATVDSSIKEDDEMAGDVKEDEEIEGGMDNDSVGSDGEDSRPGNVGRVSKIAIKKGKEVRDTTLTSSQSGNNSRQGSDGNFKKATPKWKSRDGNNDGDEDDTSSNRSSPSKEASTPVTASSGILLPPKTTMGAPVDSADRAERLKKATELALSGVTVRQAAAHYEIPRTTLCAYMKRRGLAAKRNLIPSNGSNNASVKRVTVKPDNSGKSNGEVQGGSSTHYEDFPFLGISELMDEMGQGNYAAEGYADGEEEYSEK